MEFEIRTAVGQTKSVMNLPTSAPVNLSNPEAEPVQHTITNNADPAIRGVLKTGLDGVNIRFSSDGQ